MPKFRKRPVVVEAEQFHVWNDDLPSGVRKKILGGNPDTISGQRVEFVIDTLEGEMKVSNGDWVITGIHGEKYPCKPDIFEKTYEPAE